MTELPVHTRRGALVPKHAKSSDVNPKLVVGKETPTASTAQSLIPNDTFTLSGAFQPTGSITFNLYDPNDATCAGPAKLTEIVPVSHNGDYSTSNTSFVASTEGTWRWESSYSGDSNNNPVTSVCGTERFTIANS
jgi:hypothetical protein